MTTFSVFRPTFVSQFDAHDANPAYEKANCVFAAGAMALDRHTMGAVKVTAQALRSVSSDKAATAASLGDLRNAWANYGRDHAVEKGLAQSDFNLEVSKSESWTSLVAKVRAGRGAVLMTDLWRIPRKYQCESVIQVQHALFINEVRSNGDMLVFDSVCRPTDKLPAGARTSNPGVYDDQYVSETQETQPKWIPQKYLQDAGESFNRKAGVQVGYTRATSGGGTGATVLSGDAYVVWRSGQWRSDIELAEGGTTTILSDIWEPEAELHEGFTLSDSGGFYSALTVADPAVIILGEEGQIDNWQPARDGYGALGRAYYSTAGINGAAGTSFKTRRNSWHIVPWDVPIEFFFLDQPEWPAGEAFLRAAVDRINRNQNTQAMLIVNRENLWGQIELGALIALQLTLEGPYPTGITGVVRVVGFSPDEDAGVLQLLTEWIANDMEVRDSSMSGAENDALEAADVTPLTL